MEEVMKENSILENNMDKELISGRGKNMLDNGVMVYKMAKESIIINKELLEKEFGKMEIELIGLYKRKVIKVVIAIIRFDFYNLYIIYIYIYI